MRFRTKLFLTTAMAVFVLSIGTIWPILSLMWSDFDRLANANFAAMRQNLGSLQAEHVDRMRQVGKLVMEIPDLRALIADDSNEVSPDNLASLQDRLNYLTKVMDVGFFCVFDDRGSVIAQNSSSPWSTLDELRRFITHSAPARALVRSLYRPGGNEHLTDRGEYGLWLYGGQLYQVVGLPLVFADQDHGNNPEGALVMAAPITAQMAHRLSASDNCEVTFLTADGGVISSLPHTLSPDLLRQARDLNTWKPSSTFDTKLGGETYRTYVEPLIDPCSHTPVGQVVSQTSMAQGISLQWQISRRLLVIMTVGLLVAALASYILSGAVTRPIQELVRGVRRVAQGDLTSTIAVSRRDEVGELAQAFNTMVSQLQARRELERRVTESQAANKAKSQFLANMSHEIRTPLHGVIGMANLLLGTDLNDRQRHYAHMVKSSSEVLTTLINDILDFSKIEAGKLDLESVEFGLHAVVEDVVELLYQKAVAKNVELACDIGGDVPLHVMGDPTRLRQILLNLVGNAVKFTSAGEIVVRVTRQSEQDDSMCLRFAVSDTGVGIPPEAIERLFQSFSQVDASTTRQFGGTGLGLAISKQLSELMGGGIGVESQVGRGSTFWFTVRIRAMRNAPAAPSPLAGVRVLVVEPNLAIRVILCRQLSAIGASAVGAGGDAGPMIGEAEETGQPFQVLLVSRYVEAFATVLATASMHGIPRILLAASADHEGGTLLEKSGFCAAVVKPVRRSHLLAAMADALGLAVNKTPEHAPSVARPVPLAANQSIRILIAEDNEVNQLVVAEFLRRTGFAIDVVKDGKDAVDAMADKHYDLVLMDCQMPVMDGFQATRVIRQREALLKAAGNAVRQVPIIALTANASGADRNRCLAAGMNAYCGKPFRESELLDAIAALLSTPPGPGAGPGAGAGAAPSSSPPTNNSASSFTPAAHDQSDAATQVPLNVATLLERCSGNPSLALTVLQKFEQQVADLADQIQGHVAQQDGPGVARVAHSMKGTAGIVGAEPLRQVLMEIEKIGKHNAMTEAETSLAHLRSEIQRCVACLPQAQTQLQTASPTHA